MTPYEILGIDPSCKDPKEIRRAYARLLRTHRPDTDPEGFQKLREAYEEVTRRIRYPGVYVELPDDDETLEPVPPAGGARDTASDDAASVSGGAAATTDVDFEDDDALPEVELPNVQAFRKELQADPAGAAAKKGACRLIELWRQHTGDLNDWSFAISQELEKHPHLLDHAMTRDDVVHEIRHDTICLGIVLVDYWVTRAEWRKLEQLARTMLDGPPELHDFSGLWMISRLGRALAFRNNALAEELADFAHYHAPAQGMVFSTDDLDAFLTAGKEAKRLNDRQAAVITRVLLGDEETETSPEDRRTLREAVNKLPVRSVTKQLLRDTNPPLATALRLGTGKASSRVLRSRQSRGGRSGFRLNWWYFLLAFFLLRACGQFMWSSGPVPSSVGISQSPVNSLTPELLRTMLKEETEVSSVPFLRMLEKGEGIFSPRRPSWSPSVRRALVDPALSIEGRRRLAEIYVMHKPDEARKYLELMLKTNAAPEAREAFRAALETAPPER